MPSNLLSLPKPKYNILGRKIRTRKSFKISTKKKEWNRAAGRNENDFKSTSKCRECGIRLTWGSGSYDFDHKDNNPANNSQKNCYLVCKSCHGKYTKLDKRKVKSFGMTVGYKTIRKRVGYKKQTKKKTTKKRKTKRKSTNIWGIRPIKLAPIKLPKSF